MQLRVCKQSNAAEEQVLPSIAVLTLLLVLAVFCLGSRYAQGWGIIYLFTTHLQAVPYWVDDESVRPSMLMSAPAPKVQCQQRCSVVVVVRSACS